MARISKTLKRQVATRAHYLCEYCQNPELFSGGPFHVDHILAESLGGATSLENLAYTCPRCNLHKGVRTHARDPVTTQMVPLFNPRTQEWRRHFDWNEDGLRLIGLTRTGRATILALDLNDPNIVMARSFWTASGLFPPK
jgi:hypothetical protein